MNEAEARKLLYAALLAADEAGEEILKVYSSEFKVEKKEDSSPLTLADTAADRAIEERLRKDAGYPILSEEKSVLPYDERKNWKRFWLIDPLDGTKEFINRNGEFTVNVALIEEGRPIMGVVYAPVKKVFYFGADGFGSYKFTDRKAIAKGIDAVLECVTELPPRDLTKPVKVVGSRSHMSMETEHYIAAIREKHGDVEFVSAGSSLKFCLVAEGTADFYPRLGPTMEWDTGAGQAVAENAGCDVLKITDYKDGEPLCYNKEDLHNPWFVVKRR